jgi:hypothetical protein
LLPIAHDDRAILTTQPREPRSMRPRARSAARGRTDDMLGCLIR